MKKISMIILIFINLSFNLLASDNYEPGVILLKVSNPKTITISNTKVINGSTEFQNILNKYGIITAKKLPHISERTDGSYRIEFPKNTDLKTLKAELLTCQDVRYINFNYYASYCAEPNDTYWSDQWALQKIQMPLAWDITKGDQSILVGILDSGIKYDHEDLSDNIWINEAEANGSPDVDDDGNGYVDDIRGWDFGIPDNNPMDEGGYPDYHGTRVSGVIAAKTYNSLGIAGIAGGWQSQSGVRLVAMKIANESGIIETESIRNALLYLAWLSNHSHTVIANMSLSIYDPDDDDYLELKSAVDDAVDAGVILVAAAGNVQVKPPEYDHPDVEKLPIPARWDGVLAIGASTDGQSLVGEQRSDYSMYDSYSYAKLLLVAPVDGSINVYTTYGEPDEKYINWFHGTSAACPIAVGVIAHILSINPALGWEDIEQILASTADKIGSYYYMDWLYGTRSLEVGYGRLNAYKALKHTVEHYGGTFNDDVTIADGEVFNLEPGITLKFAPNTSLIVNGTLNANGASSNRITVTSNSTTPQKGDWKWIKFDNSTGTSTLEYCDIEYAEVGIWGMGSSQVNLNHVSVENCSNWGLYLLNNENYTTVEYSSFNHANDRGIFLYNSSPQLNHATCSNNNYGLYCYNTSSPQVGYSTFSNNNYDGVYCYSSSSPWMYYQSGFTRGWNNISNNNGRGVFASSSSYPNLGINSSSYPGNNTIQGNGSYEIYNGNSSGYVWAVYNWWETADGPLFGDLYTSTTVKWLPVHPPAYFNLAKTLNPNSSNGEELDDYYNELGTLYLADGDYTKAKQAFEYVINEFPDSLSSQYALVHIPFCFEGLNSRSEIVPYLENIAQKNATKNDLEGFALAFSIPYLEREEKFNQAVERCKQVRGFYQDEEIKKNLLFIMGNIYFYGLKDKDQAKLYFNQYVQSYPDDPMAKTAQYMLEILGSQSLPKEKQTKDHITNSLPKKFALSQNYPNPFNPETQIYYQLSEDCFVTLVIYNMLGQRIRTLVNQKQPSGRYTVRWDGRDDNGSMVASGLYLYKLNADKFNKVKKMLLLR